MRGAAATAAGTAVAHAVANAARSAVGENGVAGARDATDYTLRGDSSLGKDAASILEPPEPMTVDASLGAQDNAYLLDVYDKLNKLGMDAYAQRLPDPSAPADAYHRDHAQLERFWGVLLIRLQLYHGC